MKNIQISPSILSADFSQLGMEIKRLEDGGADLIHVDVMDGHFVPNITIGPPVIKTLRNYTKLPFDVHLMISPVHKYIKNFAEAEGHHPDLWFGWGYARIKIFTHAIKGLAESDFILAAKIDKIN
ncbi:4a-hydroxytetrahydrobiopterin dehydratase [Candidatus Pelagibacter sp.]|nr:4a-hydroxytetrahydrobiopterin dehydratase [Candidatus Pelagibacter sp.]